MSNVKALVAVEDMKAIAPPGVPLWAMARGLSASTTPASAALASCELCERRCGADRIAGEPALCQLGTDTYCLKRYVSFTEEIDLVPALRVYLGGCNFRCRFCNTAPDAFEGRLGERVEPTRFAREFSRAVEKGVKTVLLLGGEPSLHAHTIREIADAADRPLPLVLDTNGYMTPQAMDLLDGIIRVYLADFKFGNDTCAHHVAGVMRYTEVITRNLAALAQRAMLRVRHVLMPGHLHCCFRPVVRWLSAHLPDVPFHLLTSYVPCWEAASDRTLGRLNTPGEIHAARAYLAACRLDWSVDGDDPRY